LVDRFHYLVVVDFLMVEGYHFPLVVCQKVVVNQNPLVVCQKVVDFLMAVENLMVAANQNPLVEYHLVVDYRFLYLVA
jgi:hypothetical protein